MNTPVIVKSRWTVADEARLVELQEQKARIIRENMAPLVAVVRDSMIYEAATPELLAEVLAACADAFVQALTPFTSTTRSL